MNPSLRAVFLNPGVLLLAVACTASGSHAGSVEFVQSGKHCRVTVPHLRSAALKAALIDKAPPPLWNLERLLDSLGYFSPSWDSAAPDTIVVSAGPRSSIDEVRIVCSVPLTLDSMAHPYPPFAYDAGDIAGIAREALTFLGNRGYPFARLSTSIATCTTSGGASHPPDRTKLRVDLTVESDQRFAASSPALVGSFRTKRTQILRDVLLRDGMLYDGGRLEASKQRLESRDYIAGVEILPPRVDRRPAARTDSAEGKPSAVAPVVLPGDTGSLDRAPEKVVTPLRISDRRGLLLDGALGLDASRGSKARFEGTLDFSLLNILGWGERASLNYKGQADYRRLDISLSKTHVSTLPILAGGGFGLDIRREQYGYVYGALRALLELRTRWRAGFGLKANETTVYQPDSTTATRTYYGGDVQVERQTQPWRRGEQAYGLQLQTGTGFVNRDGGRFTRFHMDVAASTHVPVWRKAAFAARLVTKNLFTQEDSLAAVEVYRVGGYRSVRGYADDQFAFRSVAYGQFEAVYYFSQTAAAYAFSDAGAGFPNGFTGARNDRTYLVGYGLGIRVPGRMGSVSVEWARNKDDTRSLGRVHVRLQNALSSEVAER